MAARVRGTVEVESLAEFDALVAAGARSMARWRLQDVDLRERSAMLAELDSAGALFLGCRFEPATESALRSRGALIFPTIPDLPFDPYRSSLYTPSELYDALLGENVESYGATTDARVYAWSATAGGDMAALVAQALHDTAIDDALTELVAGRRVVGVMGGHAVARGSADYRAAAVLGRGLGRRGLLVATGGGPGAMEAANLGSYLAGWDDDALDEALRMLAAVPTFAPDVDGWARAAFAVRSRWPSDRVTLGIPTWFYGHEPPNVFAGQVAKYFKNAVREDVLLHLCSAGIVFLPGAAGTVQEVFQDACENYYAPADRQAPMVLVGRQHWATTLPAWPLLRSLAAGRPLADVVHLVDDAAEVPSLLTG